MVFCATCGKPVPENAQFCRNCGARQETAPAAPPAPAPAAPPPPATPPGDVPVTKPRPGGVTAVAVLLILFGVGAFFSFITDLVMAVTYGWTPWLTYNFVLTLYFMPANIVMAVGLLMGRLWGWKLSVASLYALFYLSFPPLLGQHSLLSATVGNFVQLLIAFIFSAYLSSSRKVRAHFGTQDIWLKIGFYRRRVQSP